MTYKGLAKQILELDEEWQNADVSIHLKETNEYYGSYAPKFNFCDDGILDDNHPYLEIEA